MDLRPRDVKRLFISNFRCNWQHSISFWFKWSRKMSHKACNLQLLIVHFSFPRCHEWPGNFWRKDKTQHLLPLSLSTYVPQKQNYRAVQLPRPLKAEKRQELCQTSFTFKYRSPIISSMFKVSLLQGTSLNISKVYSIFLLRQYFCYRYKMWKEEVV